MNAKEELLGKMQQLEEWLDGTKIICAHIYTDPYNFEEDSKTYNLKQGYTHVELKEFLNSLDFNYDNGYGTQEIFGTVWFTNGIWMDRHEYDGSEHWDIHKYPEIPENLQNEPLVIAIN